TKLSERNKRLEGTSRATAEDAARRVAEAEGRRFSAEEQSVIDALAGAESEANALEAEVTKALEEGRSGDHAKAVRKLTSAQGRVDWLTGQKQQFERVRERAKQAPQNTGKDHRLATYSAPVQAWAEKHPEFFVNGAFTDDVLQAHYAAKKEGIKLDSPEYFEFIEESVGLRDPRGGGGDPGGDPDADPTSEAGEAEEHVEPVRQAPAMQRRQQPNNDRRGSPASRAAPPQRSQPGPQNTRRGQPTLTADQMEAARISYPDEYAKNPADAYQLYNTYLEKTRSEGRLLSQQRG
ncbi:MAG: hypothetical protein ACREQ5_28875, partial [Candidatus Dormibacteria bacterium]